MSWKIWRLVYQTKSTICIGFHKLGFIQRTRFYILGRSMWGALTANLTRLINRDDYDVTGENVKKNVRFTPLFPAFDKESPFLPVYKELKGLIFQNSNDIECTKCEFEKLLISAYGRTAVQPDYLSAEEGSLFETEFIRHIVKMEDSVSLFFIGYILIKDDEKNNFSTDPLFQNALKKISVGSERRYGFGQMELIDFRKDEKQIFNHDVIRNDENSDPVLAIKTGQPIFAHLSVQNTEKLSLFGDIEPIVGLEYKSDQGFGQRVSQAELCWVPGTIVKGNNGISVRMEKEPLGILSVQKQNHDQ